MRIVDTYGDAPKGAPLAIFGSFGLLEVAIRDGNAAAHFAAGPGTSVSSDRGRRPHLIMDEIVTHKDTPTVLTEIPRYTARAEPAARALERPRIPPLNIALLLLTLLTTTTAGAYMNGEDVSSCIRYSRSRRCARAFRSRFR